MKPVYYYMIGSLLIVLVSVVTYYVVRPHNPLGVSNALPPAPILILLESEGITIAGSQPTTLRWVADTEEYVTVNLAARSYGLGFMTKQRYDLLEARLLSTTTPEPANNATSTLAGQTGFRVAGHACIVGFTYTESDPTFVRPETDREVYSIIVCSEV